ncbi:MAG: ammonium transporter [archaeon]|nr:ammonium transporter [archaeon]
MAFICMTMLLAGTSSAEPAGYTTSVASSGDVSWILVSSVLVFAMVPGVAFFYGGMLRKQSMTATMAQCLIATGIMTLSWIICGYTLAFGSDGFWIGNLDRLFLNGVLEDASGGAVSELQFAMFQMMFALVTACVVIGACAERVRFTAMAWFLVLWGILVYSPMAHWVWGGGFFDQLFVVRDFAGGTVVHICAGMTGLAIAMFVGPRIETVRKSRAHSIPFTFLGAMLLWVGWFGFNGGSGLMANGQTVHVCFVTMVAGASGLVTWALCQYLLTGKVGTLGLITGGITGLVAITPGCAYVSALASVPIGIIGAALCFCMVRMIHSRVRFDDALDVFGVHGIGGIWGAIAVGLFAESQYTGTMEGGIFSPGPCGILFGEMDLLVGQTASVMITLVFCFAASYAIVWALSRFMTVRVDEATERIGQDIVEHGEPSYE